MRRIDHELCAPWSTGGGVALRAFALTFAASAVSGCGGGGSAVSVPLPPVVEGLTQYVVDPATTDAAIDPRFGEHIAYIGGTSAKGRLFLFLPESGGKPTQYLSIQKQAASNGYHSLGLAYPNSDVVGLKCLGTNNVNCEGNIRAETFTGTDSSLLVSIDAANSVENRLVKSLKYLDGRYPADRWSQFLGVGDAIRWDLIRVSGHSQGGGLAAYAATKNAVERVCTFSSPADFNDASNAPAPWLSGGVTPPERYFGFGHRQDEIVPWTNLQAIWAALGMDAFGVAQSVDATASPYLGSHMLYSDLPTASTGAGSGFHGMPVVDSATPLDSGGLPIYRSVWQYACFQ